MPSITPSYLYTFVAMIAVGAILVFSFMDYADALRVSAETKQLKSIMNTIAAESTELITLTLATNATAEAYVQVPSAIGNKQYWLQLRNDSANTWLEGGLGNVLVAGSELRLYLPKEAVATGYYIAGFGPVYLKSQSNGGVTHLQLTSASGGG